jgi:hypothetical protein
MDGRGVADRARRGADAADARGRAGARARRHGLLPALLSTKSPVGVAEYPDSDKVGVWANGTHYMLRRSEHLDYWDGER